MPATITSESTSPAEFIMATVCKICAGPIEPPDQHYHCITCLVLAHAEAALDKFQLWTLRGPAAPHAPGPPRYVSRPNLGEAHCRQHVACGPPLSWWQERRLAAPPKSTVAPFPGLLPEDCFRRPVNIKECVSFGQEEGDDSMSISASDRED